MYVSNDKDQNIYATNFGEDLAFYTNGALSIMTGGSLASTNTHNSGRVTSQASIFNTSNDMLMSNNALFASIDKSSGDDLTAQDGAIISEYVYRTNNTNELPSHIIEITDELELNLIGLKKEDLNNEKSGFKSGVYLNKNTGEITYAYAGTDLELNDIETNLLQGLGIRPDAYSQGINNAVKFNNAIQGLGIDASLTGHSLGGGIAAASSEKTGLEAKTYNAAGVHPLTVIFGQGTNNIDNYYMKYDPLSIIQDGMVLMPSASGKQHLLEPIDINSIIENIKIGHSIDTINGNSNLKDK